MLSMLSTFFYFMVVVGSTVAMLRNSDSSSSSKVPNLNEPLSAKETFIKELILNNINDSVDPCEDFYQYACGNLSANKSRDLVQVAVSHSHNNVLSILKSHPATINYQNSCQEDLTSAPRLPTLINDTTTKIENSNDVSSIMAIVGTLIRKAGIQIILQNVEFKSILLKNGLFSTHLYFDLGIDLKLSETNSQFKTHVDDLLVTNKILSHEELQQIPVIIRKESLLKKNTTFTLKDYEIEETSHRTIDDLMNRYPNTIRPLLQNLFPGKNFKKLLVQHQVEEDSFVVMDKFLTTSSLSTVKKVFKYAIVHEVVQMQPQSLRGTIDDIANYCNTDTVLRFVDVINEEYKKQYIDPKAYSLAKTISDSVLEEAKLTLNKEDSLLDEFTRKAFAKKINSIETRVGVPEIPGTRKKKELKDTTYIDMKLELSGINYSRLFDSVGTEQNEEVLTVKDTIVGAAYTPHSNKMFIFSGRLQSPLFQVDYPLVLHYGFLGSIFGHEITHSIHPESTRYNKRGPFNDELWYSSQKSKDDFDQRVKCYVDSYSKLKVTNDKGESVRNVNGQSTLIESIADSGIQFAYSAFMKAGDTEDILGYPANKLFYLSYANVLCTPLPSNEAIDARKNAKHNFAKERVNGYLMLDPNFARVFQCTATSTMNPKNKCNWWGNE